MSITRKSIELWLPSVSVPNLMVSNKGGTMRVTKDGSWVLKHQRYDKDGYLMVSVNTYTATNTTRRVHRLVAEAFVPNPNNNEVVHHKDNIKDNNDASNLEWTTISFNTKHAYSIGVIRSPHARYVKASIDGKLFSYYDSCFQCAEYFNIGRDPIEKSVSRGTLFKGFIKLEEVESVPERAVRNKTLTTKEIARSISPYRITYNNGKELIIETPLELTEALKRDRTTVYRIIKGKGWHVHNIQSVDSMSEEEYYRLHINW